MAYMLGTFIGGIIGILLLSRLWEWAVFKRTMADPVSCKITSVAAAWITASILGGFGMADGGPFRFWAFAIYLLPALVVGFFAQRAGDKLSREQDNPDGYRP